MCDTTTLYLGNAFECDPDKNETCGKSWCKFNSNAVNRECHLTFNINYKWDGKTERRVKERSGYPFNIPEEN